MPSYKEQGLEDALEASKQLVDAIHQKMPFQPQTAEQGLLELVTGSHPITLSANTLTYRFLARCSRPAWMYIAPGLRIAPTSEQTSPNTLVPLLIFSSTSPGHQEYRRTPWGEHFRISPFSRDFDGIMTYPAGLYLTETDPHGAHPFEELCTLILPFILGSNAFARTSDGALIGEDVRSKGEDAAADIEPSSSEL
ncbi:hypothetical protein HBI56_137630 [Parastagonospora nodorum]|uniref:Uncharacterized protein n=2 Tax=Phaeosphaeria nodorum (strain SN15 / ATCC MYA-4574 / FGSC 10173) TaxID=321614 RepID=Q0UQY5_PHANO|nr:hypothetical protein SNOG_05829 [Parastagonospora nodorum SN15]KAH3911903.1 hypothetical protein HBH56_130180 [Parastagonospora nodorum]EAT86893.1 hypothetical protein SNOG_05829 [Parastagonospora nodorum SN15]KAH3931630.1 hypothetical protein HBH54_093320 [Parastagonospora nodorum]KAH3947421.1 hypothetical protein HBH53_120540 [Parastagonospora nodorum]KAH3970755.1 hypothetical protein HBH51_116860 [Parastagonospora nodorum]